MYADIFEVHDTSSVDYPSNQTHVLDVTLVSNSLTSEHSSHNIELYPDSQSLFSNFHFNTGTVQSSANVV